MGLFHDMHVLCLSEKENMTQRCDCSKLTITIAERIHLLLTSLSQQAILCSDLAGGAMG